MRRLFKSSRSKESLRTSFSLLLAVCIFAGTADGASAQAYQNWYPRDIRPPAGYQYPCALTALPDDLAGIPAGDKKFINHVYSSLLKALQAKMIMLSALQSSSGFSTAYAKYYAVIAAERARIMAEQTPGGLEQFRNQVVSAIDNQAVFFDKAQKLRQQGKSFEEIMQLPEGRTASQLLMGAWGEMSRRYPAWSPQVKDSIYHHLCALDLF